MKLKCDQIQRVITLTIDYLNKISLYQLKKLIFVFSIPDAVTTQWKSRRKKLLLM